MCTGRKVLHEEKSESGVSGESSEDGVEDRG